MEQRNPEEPWLLLGQRDDAFFRTLFSTLEDRDVRATSSTDLRACVRCGFKWFSTVFDAQGVCNHCREGRTIEYAAVPSEGISEMCKLLAIAMVFIALSGAFGGAIYVFVLLL